LAAWQDESYLSFHARPVRARSLNVILVTGGTGLAGQFIVDELRRRGQAVRVLCRPRSAARAIASGAEIAIGDLREPHSLTRAARGADGIVHVACTVTDSRVDVAAMAALLGAWRDGPFVFISSLDVYGFGGPGVMAEDAPLAAGYSDYARGKIVAEQLLAEAARRAGRNDYVALRAPHIWGPHPTARRRLVVPRLLEHRPIVLPGGAAGERLPYGDVWVDARDLATIVAECLERPAGGPLNVVTGHFVWHELYSELIRLTGSKSEVVLRSRDAISEDELPDKERYAQTWRFSEARLARHLGSIPRRPFEVTVRDTVRAEAL
jgi:nucleoside-diphosphate-sugar epimerase